MLALTRIEDEGLRIEEDVSGAIPFLNPQSSILNPRSGGF
jgi:hypothetical protein